MERDDKPITDRENFPANDVDIKSHVVLMPCSLSFSAGYEKAVKDILFIVSMAVVSMVILNRILNHESN